MGKRSRGRPKNRLRDEVLNDVKCTGCEKLDKSGYGQMGLASAGEVEKPYNFVRRKEKNYRKKHRSERVRGIYIYSPTRYTV